MFRRILLYGAGAALLIGGTVYLNRDSRSPVRRIDVDPSEATARTLYAHEQLGTHCLVDPDVELQEALRNRQDYAAVHLELAEKFYARGRYRYALDRYQRAVELDPRNARAHYGMGLVQTRLGQYEAARASFEKALEWRPDLVDAALSLGLLDYRQGRFEAARKRWQAVLKRNPQNGYARELLAMIPKLTRGPSS
jgi:tetratricopeptide (TPR) repeat protein